MNLKEYKEIILSTTEDDWTVNVCTGYGSGPSFLNGFIVSTDGDGNFVSLDVETYPMIASLKKDLSISMAWGYPHNDDFNEPWANQFADSRASSDFIDFYYNGVVVFRDIYVAVDGGRCYLPLPAQQFDPESDKVIGYSITREEYNFFRIFNSMQTMVNKFDWYFDRAGFRIVDIPWME